MAVGVPDNAQVVLLIPKPEGKDGEALQDVTVPVTEGVCTGIAEFWVNRNGLFANNNEDGGFWFTVMLIVAVAVPTEDKAVIA